MDAKDYEDAYRSLPELIGEVVDEFKAETGKSPSEIGVSDRALREKARVEATDLGVNSGQRGRTAKRCIHPEAASMLRHRLISYLHKQSVKSRQRKSRETREGLTPEQVEMLVVGLVDSLFPDFEWDRWRSDAEALPAALEMIKRKAESAELAVDEVYGSYLEEARVECNSLTQPILMGEGWDSLGTDEEIRDAQRAVESAEEEVSARIGEVRSSAREAARARRKYVTELANYSKGAKAGQ